MEGNIAKGVNLMQIGPVDGHATMGVGPDGKPKKYPEFVDAESLNCAMAGCAEFKNGVKVLNTHDGSPTDIVGRAFNFRIEDGALRSDVELNPDHPAFKSLSYAINTIPDNLGFSMGFEPAYEFKGDSAFVRPKSVVHFALENETATTPDGVYSIPRPKPVKPDKMKQVDKTKEDNMDADTLKQITDAVSAQQAALMEPFTKQYKADHDALRTELKELAAYKKDAEGLIETFKKEIPGLLTSGVDGAMKTFASTKLGIAFSSAPAIDAAAHATTTATSGKEPAFVAMVRDSVKSGKFAKKTAAMEHFIKENPAAFAEYKKAGSPNITV